MHWDGCEKFAWWLQLRGQDTVNISWDPVFHSHWLPVLHLYIQSHVFCAHNISSPGDTAWGMLNWHNDWSSLVVRPSLASSPYILQPWSKLEWPGDKARPSHCPYFALIQLQKLVYCKWPITGWWVLTLRLIQVFIKLLFWTISRWHGSLSEGKINVEHYVSYWGVVHFTEDGEI